MPTPRECPEPPTTGTAAPTIANGPPPGTAAPSIRRPVARATHEVMRGRGRADAVAIRLGVGLRDARATAAMSQAEAATRARISQARWSELERGLGANAPIELWAVVAAAIGVQLAAFLEAVSGASLPRDIEHLRRQSALVERAAAGGWSPAPEMPVTRGGTGRVIDVLLTRATATKPPWSRCGISCSTWALRFDRSTTSWRPSMPAFPGWTVSGAWILRGTRRNRSLVAELAPLFVARFPADGRALLAAFDDRPVRCRRPRCSCGPMPRPTLAPWRRLAAQAGRAAVSTPAGCPQSTPERCVPAR